MKGCYFSIGASGIVSSGSQKSVIGRGLTRIFWVCISV